MKQAVSQMFLNTCINEPHRQRCNVHCHSTIICTLKGTDKRELMSKSDFLQILRNFDVHCILMY